ncbi:MAG TPA: TonB-dependent receptor [Bryobacteraceae bacterium]|nr:TonB-dependent receptor [Bryobacteraceae bacterium]
MLITRLRERCVTAVICLFLGAAVLQAQAPGTAIIAGTVVDPDGKAVPGATVSVKNEDTSAVTSVKSGSDGRFAASALPSGTYTLDASAPGFDLTHHAAIKLSATGTEDVSMQLKVADVNTAVTVSDIASLASTTSPVQASLEAHSAQSIITGDYIKHFTSPVGDYTQSLQMAPGTFSLDPNGTGLGQAKLYFRGFQDGSYTISFDGIPFEDTNTPTHHSWVFFPAPWVGGTVFDRSPGSAATVGPTNFGGSINLLSQPTQADPGARATFAYGSWNTMLLDLTLDSGNFGKGGKSSLTFDIQQMTSNGFETDNRQKRGAGSLKYVYRLSDKTTMTVWGGVVDIWTNTPNVGPTRSQIAQYGYNFLNTGVSDPSNPLSASFFGYNYYHVQSDFAYYGINTDLGHGWKLDNKVYFYRYWNKQNYVNSYPLNFASSVDKLNGYSKAGDVTSLTWESKWGIFRAGAWYEWAYTDRYQTPYNTVTNVDVPTPNFHEHFITQSFQPFAEYEWRVIRQLSITAGIKSAYYNMNLNQYQDRSKVGCLGGTLIKSIDECIGGQAFTTHRAGYNSWLPSLAAHYYLRNNWSTYAQFGSGSVIPPSAVFDVTNGTVETIPKPTIVHTYQFGSVYKINRLAVDGDYYYSKFQNPYTSYNDPVTSIPIYVLPASGDSVSKGVELEGNFAIWGGLSLYSNLTAGTAKYQGNNLWVAGAPKDTIGVGLTYQRKAWDVGFFEKHIGQQYNDGQTSSGALLNQAFLINPFNITNAFINYTLKENSLFKQTSFRLAVENLSDERAIVGIGTAQNGSTSANPNSADQLTLLAGRSVIFSMTVGYSPAKR